MPTTDPRIIEAMGGNYPGPGGMVNSGWNGGAIPGVTPFVGSPYPIPANPGAQGGSNYAQQLEALYAGVGKTGGLGGGLVDQQGWDYWSGRQAAGEDITGAFNNSARQVYANMDTDAGRASPFATQNRIGFNVMDRANAPGFAAVQQLNAQNASQNINPATGERMPAYEGPGQGGYSYTAPQAQLTMPQAAQVSTAGLNNYQQNPFLTQMGQGLRDQFTGFMNDGLAANRSGAAAAGQYGGSRQGIAEARTMTDAGRGFDTALANLYGGDYENQQRRNLQQYQGDQTFALGNRNADLGFINSNRNYDLGGRAADLGVMNSNRNYDLGLGGQALTGQNQAMNFYSNQRGQDQAGLALGANLYNMGIEGPWNPIQNANGIVQPYAGNGTTTVNTGGGGTNWQSVLGGLGAGAQFGRNLGWWGTQP